MSTDDGSTTPSVVEGYITRLLARAGLQPRQRMTYVAETLGIGYQQARRRMIGETPWTVDDVARLAASCGETLSTLFSAASPDEPIGTGTAAEIALGQARVPCLVWIGAKATSRQLSPVVALQQAKDQWLVVPTANALGEESFEVERVLIQVGKPKRHRVAVLDDDEIIATGIADYMNATGLDARAFFSLDELLEEISVKPFDGYVVDWLIDKQNTRSLIATIRAKDQTCPIVLLTGQLQRGNADESELASIASFYRLTYFEKPIRTSSIMSAMQLGFPLRGGA